MATLLDSLSHIDDGDFGGFERGQLDSIYVLERRLRKRESLNVLWE